jgi:hypothetical protein
LTAGSDINARPSEETPVVVLVGDQRQ